MPLEVDILNDLLNKLVLDCDCRSPHHTIILERDRSLVDGLILRVQYAPNGFLNRLRDAARLLLGGRSDWAEVLVNNAELERIEAFRKQPDQPSVTRQ